jgi:SAM-dependent methyltransferase
MRAEEYEKMYAIEDTYWWFVGRRAVVEVLLNAYLSGEPAAQVLDFGCGTGANSGLLSRYGQVVSQDYYDAPLGFCKRRGIARLVRASAERLPFRDGVFDLVAAMDVVEHLEDDAGALAEAARVTRPGGFVMLTVPAYMLLWSEHDEALAHKRRYTPSQARQLVHTAGLECVKLTCYMTLLFPVALVLRTAQRILRRPGRPPQTRHFSVPPFANAVLIWLQRMEARLARRVSLPFGVSIFCLARKAEG